MLPVLNHPDFDYSGYGDGADRLKTSTRLVFRCMPRQLGWVSVYVRALSVRIGKAEMNGFRKG